MLKIDGKPPAKSEIWHPYWLLEEVDSNMWGSTLHRKTWVEIATTFTGNHELYGEYMRQVTDKWKYSCEHNLTKSGDKRPWIGHAAVALALNCPEDIVREAWGHLSPEQQNAANQQATNAIEAWRTANAHKNI